jgi:predicted nucleic acid-binding protein
LSGSAKRRVQAKPEQVHLLDGNVLVALVSDTHVHHAAAQHWFASQQQPFATCPITQGTLIRVLMNLGDLRAEEATQVLSGLTAHPRHRFWPALARHHKGRLATFDGGLAGLHADVAVGLSA